MNKTDPTLFMPVGASTVSSTVDAVYYGIYWLSVFFFVAIVGSSLYFVIKYRRKRHDEIPHGPHHGAVLEVTWTVLPTILVIAIFVVGFKGYLKLAVAPGDAMEIKVTAQQWQWGFTYPNGVETSKDITVPVNKPVKLVMISKDVIHSFWVPAFRIKHDVVPGQYMSTWFEATATGEYPVLCTEYCGLSHSDMLATVKVVSQADYDKWLKAEESQLNANVSPEERGKKLYTTKACNTCHSTDGSKVIGPSFKGLYGREESFTDGSKTTVDDNYIRQSITQPMAKIVAGFAPVMPQNYNDMDEKDLSALIAYIKSLK